MFKRENRVRRVRKRVVKLYDSENALVGIEQKFSIVTFFIILLGVSAVLLAGKLMGYEDIIAERLSIIKALPVQPYTALSAVVLLISVPLAVVLSSSGSYVYTGVNSGNTLLNIILDEKKKFRRKEFGNLKKRKDKIIVEEYTDGASTFRLVKYINGKKRKKLARKTEKLLVQELELAMNKDCELFGERVAVMLEMLKTADVAKAEEEAHADYLMIALDAIVNFLREHDGATLEELKRDKEIARLDDRYIELALRYLRDAPGGPYIKEQDSRLFLSKILF